MQTTPRCAAIHDLSGFGRCSLTIVIPVLSAMGVQCCPLPTAYLSTHTGGFPGYTFLDMTEAMEAAAAHWADLNIDFRAIYSGFMGSRRQLEITADFIRAFRRDHTLVVVDPVMGDHGRPYRTYTPEMCRAMADLAARADLITPNLTEAALLLGEPYRDLSGDEGALRAIAERLSLGGRRSVVLTGVTLEPGRIGAVCFDRAAGRTEMVAAPRVEGSFHGTGDLFASVLTGALVRGMDLSAAASLAADFTARCAERTAAQNYPTREGVDFEPLLWRLGAEFAEKAGTIPAHTEREERP